MKVPSRPFALFAVVMIITATLAALFFEPLSQAIGIAAPHEAQLRQARDDFARALQGPTSKDWQPALREQGFEATSTAEPLVAIRLDEAADDCAGRGAYMMAEDTAAAALLVSAPHRGYDRFTGTLALQLFGEGDLAAAAFNSAPRKASESCDNAADLARSAENHFSAFTLAFADTYPEGRIVQLHGFDRDVRRSKAGSDADVILSNGTTSASEDLLDIADCMSASFAGRNVLVYPNDVGELGALSNAQGQALRENGFDHFVHLELSQGFRRALVADGELRKDLLACLTRGATR